MPGLDAQGECTSSCPYFGGMVAGRDGNVWFIDLARSKVGRVTPDGVIAEFDAPVGGFGNRTMTAAPDGSIWLLASSRGWSYPVDTVVRVSSDGSVKSFAIPAQVFPPSPADASGITIGPDRNIWFTQLYPPAIVRLDSSGSFHTMALLAKDSNPTGIVTGPDGNLWFLEASAIARATVAGKVVEFPFGQELTGYQATSLIAGPEKKLWIVALDRIGVATMAGRVSWFVLPPPAAPSDITMGSDGNVWFTDAGYNAIGKIRPDGSVREYPLLRHAAEPTGIATGSDGRIWFSEGNLGRIGRAGTQIPEASVSASSIRFAAGHGAARVSVLNSGDGPLQVTSVDLAGAGKSAFSLAADACTGGTVAPGASCSITVSLTNGAPSGLFGAYLRVTDNASGSPQSVALFGNLPACRLPMANIDHRGPGPTTIAWLDVSTGATADDEAATLIFDIGRQMYRTTIAPYLYGFGAGPTYDAAIGRWVPVPVENISPDGARYAYVGGDLNHANLHVVDVKTGTDRTLSSFDRFNNVFYWSVLRFAAEGIYAVQEYDNIGPRPGLYLVNPDTATVTQVLGGDTVYEVGQGAEWLEVVDPRDPHPAQGYIAGVNTPDEIVRREISTGALQTWLYRPGMTVVISSATTNSILVSVGDAKSRWTYWVLTAPNTGQEIADPVSVQPLGEISSIVLDGQYAWFTVGDALYVWTARTGALLFANTSRTVGGVCQ